MTDQRNETEKMDVVESVTGLFPIADAVIVRALEAQADALRRYLAQANQLTVGEVEELLTAFVLASPKTPEQQLAS